MHPIFPLLATSGNMLRSARGCLCTPLILPFGFATKIYGFRNDCSRVCAVLTIAYASDFPVARNFCKHAKIRVRLSYIFPSHTPYTKTLHFPPTYAIYKNLTPHYDPNTEAWGPRFAGCLASLGMGASLRSAKGCLAISAQELATKTFNPMVSDQNLRFP